MLTSAKSDLFTFGPVLGSDSRVAATERTYDVLDISDFRFTGGTAASIAEEITAQRDAGWRTGLIHLNGPLVAQVSAFNARIRHLIVDGSAELLIGREPVQARVTVVRHPAVLEQAADQLPPVQSDHVIMVANSTLIGVDGVAEYDPRRVDRLIRDRFGVVPLWAPLSAAIRDQLRSVPGLRLVEADWVNVIDADAWYSGHRPPTGDLPVIGRHSRPVAAKWPGNKADLQAVYPTDGSALVHILGGAGPARELVGSLPDSWQVWRFGTREPRDFLADLDLYVYYPHPRWVEAFGRNVLEAMAAGVPTVLPPVFRSTFGELAHYAEPDQARSVIHRLHRDRELWQQTADAARQQVRETFGHRVHRDRLQAIAGLQIGGSDPAPVRAGSTSQVPVGPVSGGAVSVGPVSGREVSGGAVAGGTVSGGEVSGRPRLLLISSNGTGMGHLMRLMAYGRRATDFEPHVLSLSQGVGAVRELGMPFEYVPSANALGMSPRNWQPIFTERVGAALDRIRPSVVVFDGTWPYSGIGVLRSTHPDPVWVWSRRGMWQQGRSGEQLAKSEWFDEVVEPGDFASAADTGPTASAPAVRVPPVTLLDADDLLPTAVARHELGLPADGRMALITFSGGRVDDVTSDTAAAIAACRRIGLQACVTRSVVSPYIALPDDVHVVNRIPLAMYQRAFDVAISAAGYNSFHELLRFGTPTLFVPKRNSSLDDQDRRARYAADQGWCRYATTVTESQAVDVLTDLLDNGPEMIARVAMSDPGNGAVDMAKLLADIHERRAV